VIEDFDTLMITSDPCPFWHLRPHVAAGQRPLIATLPGPWVLTVNEARRFLLGPDARALLDEAAAEPYDMHAFLQGRHAV
jgi:hypothetical protein